MKVITRPIEIVVPNKVWLRSRSQTANASHDGQRGVSQGLKGRRRAGVRLTALTLASRLAALVTMKFWMFSSSRLKACTSRTAEMLSCSSALTLPRSWRA